MSTGAFGNACKNKEQAGSTDVGLREKITSHVKSEEAQEYSGEGARKIN